MTASAPGSDRARPRLLWLTALLGLAVLAILVALGTWQVERLAWKEALLASIGQRMSVDAVPLDEMETRYRMRGDVDYMPVTATGRFRHAGERHFLATWQGKSGFHVYAPLELADGRVVMVNRGFVPYDLKDPARRAAGQVEGEVTISGLARNPLSGKPSWILPDNDVAANIFFWKDRDAMARSAGLPPAAEIVPFFIDADATPNPGGWPVGGVTLIEMPNNHLQYAVTWYGLAAALVGVFGVWFWRRRVSR
jgi:surfeit locus 1 family protein